MERFHHFRYSEIKPVVRFARDHWSNPDTHTPWRGFEDLKVDVKHQLKAVRRQIVSIAAFHMENHGDTPLTIVPKLESTLFPQNHKDD